NDARMLVAKKGRLLTLYRLLTLGIAAAALGITMAWWHTSRNFSERFTVGRLVDSLPRLDAGERHALVAEELVNRPEPERWQETLNDLWHTGVPSEIVESVNQAPIRGASLSADGRFLAWYSSRLVRLQDL